MAICLLKENGTKIRYTDKNNNVLPYLDKYVVYIVGDLNNQVLKFEGEELDILPVMGNQVYHIEGMNCNHCRMSAEKALKSVAGVTDAIVDLASKEARVTGNASMEDIKKAIDEIGFEVKIYEKHTL